MTANARIVLADCREAHGELVDGLMGSPWRRRWATVVVLLRTTLDVLGKVDRVEGAPEVQDAIDAAWIMLNEARPDIYFKFIKSDRDSLVHEYQYLAGQNATILLGEKRTEITYSMNDGPFKGQDPRAVASQAIEWLDQYLSDIDQLARVGIPGPEVSTGSQSDGLRNRLGQIT
jgi:hypothetical protein